MKISLLRPDHGVARRQHSAAFAALLGAALLGAARPAAAADASAASPTATPAASDERGGYGVPLAFAYALAPLFAVGVGGTISKADLSDEAAGIAGGAMFLAPAGVHLYEGAPGRALGSVGSMLGLTFTGVLLGAGGGYLENQLNCDPERNSECEERGYVSIYAGAAIGGVIGYASSAILDVVLNSSAPRPAAADSSPVPRAAPHVASVWLVPLSRSAGREPNATQQGSASAKPPLTEGLVLGLTVSL